MWLGCGAGFNFGTIKASGGSLEQTVYNPICFNGHCVQTLVAETDRRAPLAPAYNSLYQTPNQSRGSSLKVVQFSGSCVSEMLVQ